MEHNNLVKISPELLEMMGSRLPGSLMPFSREIFIMDIVVAGTSHCKRIDKVYPSLQKDTVLRMQRHPRNRYDKQAIGIYYDKVRIGWVPRELNLVIARLMDAGKAFLCRIDNVGIVNDHWVRIDAKVYMVE